MKINSFKLFTLTISLNILGQAFAQENTGNIDSLSRHEFDYRMQMTLNRLTTSKMIPQYTEQFILADVNLDPANPRRFYNFSGDLSGRYIEVLSMAPKKSNRIQLPQLVSKLISFQQADGRFGSKDLIFTEDKISGEHMALLWGNGRLLVGLMQYYKEYHDPNALQAAKRLGDFFISSYEVCSTPAVSKRLEGMMAMGIICFTQYIEGLIMLTEFSGDAKYANIAAKTYPVLPPRGKQHTHGYLSTLRGVLMLYNYDHKPEHLDFVRKQYDDLVSSDDYTSFGSVREYFGHMDVDRDEGCSTADFLRLSFDLYKVTGNKTYLDKGEFSLLNALYFNQYYTGDFGHHVLNAEGSSPDFLHASWWCCTMHGLRAMYEVRNEYMTEHTAEGIRLNLYIETTYTDKKIGYTITKDKPSDGLQFFHIRLNSIDAKAGPVALRVPSWAEKMEVMINGKKISTPAKDDYLQLGNHSAGTVIRVGFKYRVSIHTGNAKSITPSQLSSSPVAGSLHYGPYLMGADDKTDPIFVAEPNDNTVYLKAITPVLASPAITGIRFPVRYSHSGFPSDLQSVLRPVGALTFNKHAYLMTRLQFASEPGTNKGANTQSMLNPFDPNAKKPSN
ncbi:glycoside hydrolase family 127 protein [Terrimonas sp. NA20]|uniref:Glycoside hydrolase family 127 protein n=1 Tax=Terrimonas ginsenosidimutans TaxID=2908004 RepID=A0ABS9KSC6_9BACT|nr:beta-L-arabinofuranosidase domain-containing protein [Terrimonas ginsenosidimutans]MCG2615241.1 glycoside hydrolase family 127 protein [Terrimonas ginsenosidimutans]